MTKLRFTGREGIQGTNTEGEGVCINRKIRGDHCWELPSSFPSLEGAHNELCDERLRVVFLEGSIWNSKGNVKLIHSIIKLLCVSYNILSLCFLIKRTSS
jgi:hypothetical protein